MVGIWTMTNSDTVISYEEECKSVTGQSCHPVFTKKCGVTYEKECAAGGHPRCKVVHERICSNGFGHNRYKREERLQGLYQNQSSLKYPERFCVSKIFTGFRR